jgi:putative endonuclease
VTLRWAEEFARVDDAYAAEKRIQGWGHPERQALIEGDVHLLSGLSSRSWSARRGRGES